MFKIKYFKQTLNFKFSKFSFSNKWTTEDLDKIHISKDQIKQNEEIRLVRDCILNFYVAEEREKLRKGFEEAKRRQEAMKRGDKEYLLKMKVPGIPEAFDK